MQTEEMCISSPKQGRKNRMIKYIITEITFSIEEVV